MPREDLERARQRVARIMMSGSRNGTALNAEIDKALRAHLAELKAEGDTEAERLLLIDDLAKAEADKRRLQDEVDRLKRDGAPVIDRA